MADASSTVETTPFSSKNGPLNRTALELPDLLSGDFWAELRVFLAVAKGQSFSRAASVLGMSAKTVARHVKRLQDVMKTALVVQAPYGVVLTDAGRELAEHLAELDYRLFRISADMRVKDQRDEAMVRIGITDALGAFFVAPSLAAFRAERPGVRIEIRSIVNANDFRENKVDLMLSSLPALGDDVLATPCGAVHFNPVASLSYIARKGLPTVASLDAHEFVQSPFYETEFWSGWKQLVARGRTVAVCDSSFAYGSMATTGAGIALLATFMTLHPAIVPLNLGVTVSAPIFIVCLKGALSSPGVRQARTWLADLFSKDNPWFGEDIVFTASPNRFDAGLRRLFAIDGVIRPASG